MGRRGAHPNTLLGRPARASAVPGRPSRWTVQNRPSLIYKGKRKTLIPFSHFSFLHSLSFLSLSERQNRGAPGGGGARPWWGWGGGAAMPTHSADSPQERCSPRGRRLGQWPGARGGGRGPLPGSASRGSTGVGRGPLRAALNHGLGRGPPLPSSSAAVGGGLGPSVPAWLAWPPRGGVAGLPARPRPGTARSARSSAFL